MAREEDGGDGSPGYQSYGYTESQDPVRAQRYILKMPNMTPLQLLEHLESIGLIREGKLVRSALAHMPLPTLADLATELATPEVDIARQHSIFSHTASIALGGGHHECEALECRLQRVTELAQYALMFADRIYVRNPFTELVRKLQKGKISDRDVAVTHFADDLAVFLAMAPLFKNGLIVPRSPEPDKCPHCTVRDVLGDEAAHRYELAHAELKETYRRSIDVSAKRLNGELRLTLTGPKHLIAHGSMNYPIDQNKMPQRLRRIPNGSKLRLTSQERARLKADEILADELTENVQHELTVNQALGTSYLTHSPSHVDFLRKLSADEDLAKKNMLSEKHLTSLFPFIQTTSTSDLLLLREREKESFEIYRKALHSALETVRRSSGGDLTDNNFRSLYADVIAPELARLEKAVRVSRNDILFSSGKSIAGWGAALSIGLYLGALPTQLVLLAQALGLVKVAQELVSSALSFSEKDKAIRSEPFYFLWRSKKLSD
jgi:hypothetical protein